MLPTSSYVHGTGAIFLSNLRCSGDESAILDCYRWFNIPIGLVKCSHAQDVGVLCPGKAAKIEVVSLILWFILWFCRC